MKRYISLMLVIVLLFSLTAPTSADMGGYLEQLMNDLKESHPYAYKGQERGYFMGGSAAVRFTNDNQPLISLTQPNLKIGCGGIDLVMGGFSYLNFEYLVQKLQSIMQAAPAFAFQMALKVMCEQCADILSSLEHLTNQINNLNVDSCQAAKAIGGWAGEQVGKAIGNLVDTGSSSSWFSGASETMKDIGNSYQKWIEEHAGYYDCAMAGDPDLCREKQSQVNFFTPLLTQAFNKVNKSEFPFEGIIRARYGDVFQDKNKKTESGIPPVEYDPGCSDVEGGSDLISSMVHGIYKSKDAVSPSQDVNCRPVEEAKPLKLMVKESLYAIKAAIENGAPLEQKEINLVNTSRIPIYRIMSLTVLMNKIQGFSEDKDYLSEGFIEEVSVPLAYDIAYSAVSAALTTLSTALNSARFKQLATNPEVVDALGDMVDNLKSELRYSAEADREAWIAFKDKFGDAFQREQRMTEVIYRELGRNKLLDSYLFARGLR